MKGNKLSDDKEFGTDIGLRLPNGEEVWPPSDYKGFPLKTAEDRGKLAAALVQTEKDLSLKPGDFVSQHVWVQREWEIVAEFAVDDSIIAPQVQEETDGGE